MQVMLIAESIKLKSLLFKLSFLLFLITHIRAYHFLIQTNRINAVTVGPKVISPIRFCLEVRIVPENMDRCPTFQDTHHI